MCEAFIHKVIGRKGLVRLDPNITADITVQRIECDVPSPVERFLPANIEGEMDVVKYQVYFSLGVLPRTENGVRLYPLEPNIPVLISVKTALGLVQELVVAGHHVEVEWPFPKRNGSIGGVVVQSGLRVFVEKQELNGYHFPLKHELRRIVVDVFRAS